MKPAKFTVRGERGALLVELMVTVSVAVVVVGVLVYASTGISRSVTATDQYMVGVANTNRILDTIALDVRRAVRIGILSGTTTTPIKDTGTTTYTVGSSNILVIHVPDYYGSNTPNNVAGSTFKTTRYSRATLNTSSTYNGNGNTLLNGTVPWTDAQTTVNGKAVTRFTPIATGTGELQIRYYIGQRSSTDATQCLLRSEYPSGATSPTSTREIAEKITDSTSTTSIVISGANGGQTIRLQSSFTPRFRNSGVSPTSATTLVDVNPRNPRRD